MSLQPPDALYVVIADNGTIYATEQSRVVADATAEAVNGVSPWPYTVVAYALDVQQSAAQGPREDED